VSSELSFKVSKQLHNSFPLNLNTLGTHLQTLAGARISFFLVLPHRRFFYFARFYYIAKKPQQQRRSPLTIFADASRIIIQHRSTYLYLQRMRFQAQWWANVISPQRWFNEAVRVCDIRSMHSSRVHLIDRTYHSLHTHRCQPPAGWIDVHIRVDLLFTVLLRIDAPAQQRL
jgi:hypothetical protein